MEVPLEGRHGLHVRRLPALVACEGAVIPGFRADTKDLARARIDEVVVRDGQAFEDARAARQSSVRPSSQKTDMGARTKSARSGFSLVRSSVDINQTPLMSTKATWGQLLSGARLRQSGEPKRGDEGNEFLSDYQRVVFSSAFRRLQDKTQVTPLATSDFLRKRLTHSVEVSVIGERMGRVLARRLEARLPEGDQRDPFGKVVATACLLHDIGNPPFGHEGEMAIREWVGKKGLEYPDYQGFDGNAQGFRIAVRLQNQGKEYGMNLTVATLSAMVKYPSVPTADKTSNPELRRRGKWGVLSSEAQHYKQVWDAVGLKPGARHPLSFVVEAADDIVNRLVDIEDALKAGLVTFNDVREALASVQDPQVESLLQKMIDSRDWQTGPIGDREMRAYQGFRVNAAAALAESCEDLFESNVDKLEDGSFEGALVDQCEMKAMYSAIKKVEDTIFDDAGIVRVEAGGKAAIASLLDTL